MSKNHILNVSFIVLITSILCSCNSSTTESEYDVINYPLELVVLGIAQDAGAPQIGCEKSCCTGDWIQERPSNKVACLGIIDRFSRQLFLIDATPDIKFQWNKLQEIAGFKLPQPSGILLTHAHTGHYLGLAEFGREAMSAKQLPVYAMPGMERFLTANGPWSQLVELEQIMLMPLQGDSTIKISPDISITPVCVPHRDEFSETVGYKIKTNSKTALYIPDIDKWHKWEHSIVEEVQKVDMAFLDATFYNADELPGRDMSEIPHPFVVETMDLLKHLPQDEKSKVHFIHMNHTNELRWNVDLWDEVGAKYFNVALEGDRHVM